MNKNLTYLTIIVLLLFAKISIAQTVLFHEDFGTSYSGTHLLTNWCSSSSYANSSSSACDGYSWYAYGSADYARTNDIAIPTTGTTELTFDYKFNQFSSYPTVEISTSGCYGTYSSVRTLTYQGTCFTESIDLSSYAGQTVNIRFYTWNSSGTFILDNVDVSNTSGGGGTTCTDLFVDDFGTSYSGTYLLANWCRSSSSANSSSSACDGYSWYAYGSGDYINTDDIVIPATGTSELSFDYKFNQFSSYPTVSISTSGCYGTYSTVQTLAYKSTCFTETIDLSAYAGQTINIRFYTWNSSGTFILDNVQVQNCTSGGGSTTDLKWADNFNDNDLDLDFTGNDGDEDCSGQAWDIGTGSLVSGSQTVNHNETEAFSDGQTQGYSIQLDKGEYFESPTVDMSSEEALKISFYIDQSSGTFTDWIGSHVYLQIWDGSSWIQVMSLGGGAGDDENMLASGFGYHCFTAFKSTTSPGNYYYSATPNVNSAYFNSDFKFRIEIQGFGSVGVYVDNVTFRADNDGELLVPCGISYWNSVDATYYGRDTDGSKAAGDSKRGVEVEIDDPFGIGSPPDWSGHCNDGNIGTDASGYYTVWAVVSEQEISTVSAKLYYTNGTTNVNVNLSQDNTYAGPGYLYYYKLYTGCNGEVGAFYPDAGLSYAFWFDFGSNMPSVYYQLNSTGIEKGGGVTASTEYLAPGLVCSVLPVEISDLYGINKDSQNTIYWSTASEINNSHFEIERSLDGYNFYYLDRVKGRGNSNYLSDYRFDDDNVDNKNYYYRLKQVDYNASFQYSKLVYLESEKRNAQVSLIGERTVLVNFSTPYYGNLFVVDISGRVIEKRQLDGDMSTEVTVNGNGLFFIQFDSSEILPTKKIIIP